MSERKPHKFYCLICLHDWQQNDGTTSPFPSGSEECAVRTCRRCEKQQEWLPGYGGSELGCWLTVERSP